MAAFRRTRKGVSTRFRADEAIVLRQLVSEVRSLVAEPGNDDEGDPLESLVGMSSAEPQKPSDPVLGRLLPDGYAEADDAAEFRRFTEPELRAVKRTAADTVLSTLPQGGGAVVLDDEEAQTWLAAINDVRLTLGTRLNVTEDMYDKPFASSDPRLPQLAIYDWLTGMQESLVRAVAGW